AVRCQAAARTDRQRARVDRGAAGIGVRAGQGQGSRAVLDQAAGAGDDTTDGQGVATEHVEVRASRETDAVRDGDRRRRVERCVRIHSERAATQRRRVAEGEAAGIECHATAEGVRTGQCLHARAILHQAARTRDDTGIGRVADTAQGQRAAAQGHGAARDTCQRTDRLRATGGDVEARTGRGEVHRARRRQATAQADREDAGIDRRATREGVGSRQRLGTGADLGQSTGASDGSAEGAIGRTADGQRVGADIDRTGTDERAEGLRAVARGKIERGARLDVDDATRGEAGASTEGQRACCDRRAAGIRVRTVQGERRRALLGQAAGAVDIAVESHGVGAEHRQPRVERDLVRQRDRAAGIQRRGTAHRQLACAQCRV
ncbi:hypothetical protein KCV01_g24951, partial [Aureobasidium melanogenum]